MTSSRGRTRSSRHPGRWCGRTRGGAAVSDAMNGICRRLTVTPCEIVKLVAQDRAPTKRLVDARCRANAVSTYILSASLSPTGFLGSRFVAEHSGSIRAQTSCGRTPRWPGSHAALPRWTLSTRLCRCQAFCAECTAPRPKGSGEVTVAGEQERRPAHDPAHDGNASLAGRNGHQHDPKQVESHRATIRQNERFHREAALSPIGIAACLVSFEKQVTTSLCSAILDHSRPSCVLLNRPRRVAVVRQLRGATLGSFPPAARCVLGAISASSRS
jgi:hypothetical protein